MDWTTGLRPISSPLLFDEVDRGLLCHHGKYSKKLVNKLKFCDL